MLHELGIPRGIHKVVRIDTILPIYLKY